MWWRIRLFAWMFKHRKHFVTMNQHTGHVLCVHCQSVFTPF